MKSLICRDAARKCWVICIAQNCEQNNKNKKHMVVKSIRSTFHLEKIMRKQFIKYFQYIHGNLNKYTQYQRITHDLLDKYGRLLNKTTLFTFSYVCIIFRLAILIKCCFRAVVTPCIFYATYSAHSIDIEISNCIVVKLLAL